MESPYLLVSPALAGFVAGFAYMAPTLQAAARAGPEGKARALALAAVAASAPILAFVAAFLADQQAAEATLPLLLLGAAGAVQCLAQALIVRMRVPRMDLAGVQAFGRLLPLYAAPQALTLLAFMGAFLAISPPAA